MRQVILTNVYQKTGAVFASASDAFVDKNSLYTEEQNQQINETTSLYIQNEVYLQPTVLTWNQDTFQLTIQREIADLDKYKSLRTYDGDALDALAAQAGWTLVSRTLQDI